MTTTSVQVDLADVKAVLDLEPKIKALVEEIRAVLPAVQRLMAAKYAGAEDVETVLVDLVSDHRNDSRGDTWVLLWLDDFRVAEGDQAKLDYYRLVTLKGFTISEAIEELRDADDDVDRLSSFLTYAKAQARP